MPRWDEAIDPADPALEHGVALMYSGGCDSTLAAARLAERFPKVKLVTYLRLGFLHSDHPDVHFERMQRRFPQSEITLHKLPYGKMYEEIEGHKKLRSLLKHGTMTSVPCGHCKLAMHWRTALFCIEHGIRFAADGAVHGNEQFAEQNENILIPELVDFYAQFGITLVHPVFEYGLDTEAELFRLGITDSPQVKRTTKDKQVICTQHILLGMFMRRYMNNHTFEEYEAETKTYLSGKLDHARELTEEWVASEGKGGRLARLLERSAE
ncbi:MAG: hypothetical protein H6732_00705 [Alphaproteobacteria bacterium]|nr:hypothetical protein [Alphaproteobacteria bacterium]